MTTDSSDDDTPKRRTVQLDEVTYDRLTKIATRVNYPRNQVIEWLLNRQPMDALVKTMKAEQPPRRLAGRKKASIFTG